MICLCWNLGFYLNIFTSLFFFFFFFFFNFTDDSNVCAEKCAKYMIIRYGCKMALIFPTGYGLANYDHRSEWHVFYRLMLLFKRWFSNFLVIIYRNCLFVCLFFCVFVCLFVFCCCFFLLVCLLLLLLFVFFVFFLFCFFLCVCFVFFCVVVFCCCFFVFVFCCCCLVFCFHKSHEIQKLSCFPDLVRHVGH